MSSYGNKPPPGTRFDPFNPINDGLLAWWPLNEGAGGRTSDIAFGHDGLLDDQMDMSRSWSGSPSGGGLRFDGVDDYVEVPYRSALDVPGAFSIVLRAQSAKLGTAYSDTGFAFDMGFVASRGYGIGVDSSDNDVFGYYNGNLVHTGVDLDTNWHHYALTYDGTTLRLYEDGVEVGAQSTTVVTIDDNPLRIGGQSKAVDRFWDGTIDEVKIYKRALTTAEVKRLDGVPYGGSLHTSAERLTDWFLEPSGPSFINRIMTVYD